MTRFQAVKIYELNQLHRWIGHEGPKAPKHKGWLHPLVVVVLHYAVVGAITFRMHDLLLLGRETIEEECSTMQAVSFRKTVAAYCGWYIFLMQTLRLLTLANKQAVLYEATWLCNVTLVMGPLGLYWNRPTIASAYCITIGIDQLLWYIDLLGYTMRWDKNPQIPWTVTSVFCISFFASNNQTVTVAFVSFQLVLPNTWLGPEHLGLPELRVPITFGPFRYY